MTCLLPTSAFASDLKVANAWVSIPESYEIPPAYFLIQNRDSKNRTIVGGRCERCGWIEIQHVVFKDGGLGSATMETMEIPAGGAVAFVPRGLFISLIGLGPVERGTNFPLEIEFKSGEKHETETTIGQS
jgi:copper(I)-binding protein